MLYRVIIGTKSTINTLCRQNAQFLNSHPSRTLSSKYNIVCYLLFVSVWSIRVLARGRQCSYNVTFWRLPATIVTLEK